jgi:hypothetical protein
LWKVGDEWRKCERDQPTHQSAFIEAWRRVGQEKELVAILEVVSMWLIKALDSLGLIFGIVGTILMIRGGLDAFIKIVPREENNENKDEIHGSSIGNKKIELDFKEPDDPNRLLTENKLGMGLLGLGFFLQLISITIDWILDWILAEGFIITINKILLISAILGVLAATLIFYSSMGILFDRRQGRLFGISKTEPEDRITRLDYLRLHFKKIKLDS